LLDLNPFVITLNWFWVIEWKDGNNNVHVRFLFKQIEPKKSCAIINKDYKPTCPEILVIVDSPHTSPWINLKGCELLFLLVGKDTRVCLANAQASQCSFEVSRFSNKWGNIIFKTENDGFPKRQW